MINGRKLRNLVGWSSHEFSADEVEIELKFE